MSAIKVGLLPLYVKLYDDMDPGLRARQMPFLHSAVCALEAEGLELALTEVCCVREEFERAVDLLIREDVAAVVTLHLAYSPSLEAVDALSRLPMPIVMMDTTPTFDFIAEMSVPNIDCNHGIHGVQDLCSMLKRRGIGYHIACGHLGRSDVAARTAGLCRAAAAARALRRARVGVVGGPFDGMGDFRVDEGVLASVIGARVIQLDPAEAASLARGVDEAELAREMRANLQRCEAGTVDEANHRLATRAGLALRAWITRHSLSAVSANFAAVGRASGLPKMPFVELSQGMARGIGYAGEGDALTAALVGALLTVYPETSFTEMFCPDWSSGTLLLSHMAELNPALTIGRPLLSDVPFPYTDCGDTVGLSGCLMPGAAVLLNLAPLSADRFSLILAEVDMLDAETQASMSGQVRGWMRPRMALEAFLTRFSQEGGTHHSALVYGANILELQAFGEMMGFEVVRLI